MISLHEKLSRLTELESNAFADGCLLKALPLMIITRVAAVALLALQLLAVPFFLISLCHRKIVFWDPVLNNSCKVRMAAAKVLILGILASVGAILSPELVYGRIDTALKFENIQYGLRPPLVPPKSLEIPDTAHLSAFQRLENAQDADFLKNETIQNNYRLFTEFLLKLLKKARHEICAFHREHPEILHSVKQEGQTEKEVLLDYVQMQTESYTEFLRIAFIEMAFRLQVETGNDSRNRKDRFKFTLNNHLIDLPEWLGQILYTVKSQLLQLSCPAGKNATLWAEIEERRLTLLKGAPFISKSFLSQEDFFKLMSKMAPLGQHVNIAGELQKAKIESLFKDLGKLNPLFTHFVQGAFFQSVWNPDEEEIETFLK